LFICKFQMNSLKEFSWPNPMSISFSNIWIVIWKRFCVCLFSFNRNNIFLHFIEGFGNSNRQISWPFFLHVHLCLCIYIICNWFFKTIWSIVKYLLTIFLTCLFEKMLYCGAYFIHSNPWSCAWPVDWNFVTKNNLVFHQTW